MNKEVKLNLGCGPEKIEGYIGCDVVDMPGVDVVCSVDKLPYGDEEVDEILAEHLIEHLTFEEFNRTIVEWYRVLKVGGTLTIECPDLLGLCKQFVETNEFGRFQSYKGYWAIIHHLYGHQRGKSQEEKFAQIHKSGYTVEHLKHVLGGVGFKLFTQSPPKKGVPGTAVLRLSCVKGGKNIHSLGGPND